MTEAVLTATEPRETTRAATRSPGAFAHIWTIAKRELAGYFESPIAYVFIVIFLLLVGFFTFMVAGFFERGEANLEPFFVWLPWLSIRRSGCGCGRRNDVSARWNSCSPCQ